MEKGTIRLYQLTSRLLMILDYKLIHSPILESIKGSIENVIVPLIGWQLVRRADYWKGVDQVCAEVWVYIFRNISTNTWSVLGPVGEVAHQVSRRHCWRGEKLLESRSLKVLYATFYGPMNKRKDRALDTRNCSLKELTWILDVF